MRQIQPIADRPVIEAQAAKISFRDIKEYKVQAYDTETGLYGYTQKRIYWPKASVRFIPVPGMDIKDTNPESTNK
jgi:hypothetical protein